MTIAIKPTATTATIEHNDSTILTVDSSGNITPSNDLYPKVPAFSATFASDYSFSHNVWQKIPFSTEEFDTNSDYDHSTNYRFTASVAGKYQFNLAARVNYSSTAGSQSYILLYKNGSPYTQSETTGVTSLFGSLSLSAMIDLDVDDYVEAYTRTNHQSPFIDANVGDGNSLPKFQGYLVSV